jgi:DNA-binding IscR family transcriptional regulator
VTSNGECYQTHTCTVREPLRRVNESICQVLNTVTISQMAEDSNGSVMVELRG